MKKLLFTIGVATVLTACSTANYTTHNISETDNMKRQVYDYGTYVEIHTITKMSKERFNELVANTIQNRDERN